MIKLKKYIAVIACILWMCFIFYNSTRSGFESNTLSYSVVNNIRQSKNAIINEYKQNNEGVNSGWTSSNDEKTVKTVLPKTKKDNTLNLILRKNAHGFEYLVLSILLSIAFILNGRDLKSNTINILFISLFYAVTDEFHQIFVIGRTSSVEDVLIDFAGALIGLLIVSIATRQHPHSVD